MRRPSTLLFAASLTAAVLLSSVAIPAQAAPPLFFGGVGYGKWVETGAPSGSAGFQAGLMGQVHPQIALGAEVSYQLLGKDTFSGFPSSYDVSHKVIPVVAEGYWMVPTTENIRPLISAGLGAYNLRASSDIGGSSSTTKFGFNFGVGAIFGSVAQKVRFGVDGKYHIIDTPGKSTQVAQIMGRLYFGG